MRKIRLFVGVKPLKSGILVKISDNDFFYLTKVMRKKIGDELFIFNGFDGEFKAKISAIAKKDLVLEVLEKTEQQHKSGLVSLAFAPAKNVAIDFIAKKATEMGVARFLPIITHHSVVDKINVERFQANIKEALEQCERNDIAVISPIKKLEKLFFDENDSKKIFILCDESGQGLKAHEILPKIFADKNSFDEIIILIGPEGGFSADEFKKMREIKNLYSISLGKNILRCDTAVIAALALVSEFL